MSEFRIERATAVPFADVVSTLTGGGDGASCWCQWFQITRAEMSALSVEERRDRLRDELASTSPSPALIAYDGPGADAPAVGWIRVGPRTGQPGLARTRIVRRGSDEPAADADVWAASCIAVRREARGRGVARALVGAAVRHARDHGARVLEAYPIDLDRGVGGSNDLYVGALSTFLREGFEVVARPTVKRAVVALRFES